MPKEPVEIRLPKQDYLSLLAAMVAAGSVFFPWFNIEVVTSYSGYTNHQLYGAFKGTYVEGGWAGLSRSLFCVVMFFLLGISALIGLYPQLILVTIENVIRGLTFVRVTS